MGKLKAMKKAAKKAGNKVSKPVKITKSTLEKFVSDDKGVKAMANQIEELEQENTELRNENTKFQERIKELEANQADRQSAAAAKKFIRGMLPGNKYTKTDPETGKFEEIEKAEWDSLA